MGSEMPQQFDDVLTELLIDKINLWFKTFKLNPSYYETNVSREVLVNHIQRHVIQPNKITNAAKELLKIPSVLEAAGVTSENEKEFISHANRYFEMYLPNAGCEIAETPRYSGSDKREACIIATKKWQVGDEIKYCTGVLVPITSEEERALEGGRDFSIMWSTRKDCMCLLLGPARFVNHDCNPNTHFIATGQNTISFKLLRDVAIGEELTAHYGENYFGQGNEECLCVTCEQKQTGGFRKVRGEAEEEAYEGLRPFVYNDGRLVRRSMRRNKAIQFNNTTKGKSKSAPVRINNKIMEIADDDLIAESSSQAAARAKSNNKDLAGSSNQDIHFKNALDINSAQRTEYSTPMSMDTDTDISPADDRATFTQTGIDVPRERITSAGAQSTVNTSVPERTTSTIGAGNRSCPMRPRMLAEPMSFKALFSATVRSKKSIAVTTNPFSSNPNRLFQDADASDQELRTNIISTDITQESYYQSSRTPTSNTVSQEGRKSTSQRPNEASGELLHTTITNSRTNQEITTGLSIQSHNIERKRVSSIAPVTVNRKGYIVSNQSSDSRFSRQHVEPLTQKGLPVTSQPINLNESWAGVKLTANPNIRVTWGTETIKKIIVPGNNSLRQKRSFFPTTYNGTENNPRAANNNTSRMSIAYLCSNDLPRQDDASVIVNLSNQKLSGAGFLNINDKSNIKRVCRVCNEKFVPLPIDITAHKCPRCSRHFSLYNLEWPLRKQPREKGKAKETKNRSEAINRRDKKSTAMAAMITTSKGKAKQVASMASVGDKKEHNERMQAIIFAEGIEEWLPIPGIDKEKYVVGEEQPVAGKAFSISMKRKKNTAGGEAWYKPFLRWSASTGYVHLNSIWRYFECHIPPDNSKLKMVKKKVCKISRNNFEGSGSFQSASLQGGYATYQGDWVPYVDAQKIVEELGQPELLRKFILSPSGNVIASSFSPTAVSSKRMYEEVDAGDSDAEPSHKKRT